MAANIVSNLATWSTTATSNQPDSTDSADIAADLQQIQATVRKYLRTIGADIASASTTDLANATGDYVSITGTTSITALGTVSAGMRFILRFTDALTLTHNATSLILPSGSNITTTAGDIAWMESLGSGNWRCLLYSPSGSSGSSLVGYLNDGTGAIATTVQSRLRERASIMDFGAVANGSTDCLAALNLAIAALNDGTIKSLYFPDGIYALSANPNAITASDWAIYGRHAFIQFVTGSTTAGTFFTIGSAAANCDNWSISGLKLRKSNADDLGGTQNAINVVRGTDGWISNISFVDCNGLVTLGNATYAATRIRFSNIEGTVRGDKGGKVIDIVNATGFRFDTIRISCNTTEVPAHADFRVVNITPATAVTIDSGVWIDCEFNHPNQSVTYIMEVDATSGAIVTNQFFTNCIFDHAITASIWLHMDTGTVANARIANFTFTGCRAVCEDSGGPIILDNTGAESMFDINFNGGFLNTYDEAAVRILSGSVFARFDGVRFSDVEGVTAKPCISTASGEVTVTNCVAMKHNALTTSAFNYGVQFTANVNGFNVTGNNFDRCSIADVDTSSIGDSSGQARFVGYNIAPSNYSNFRVTTTDATATVIASWLLAEAGTYHVRAVVVGVLSDGSQRASYELIGTFYRDGTGNVTQQGSTTSIHAVESDTNWACVFVNSTTAAQVRVTGVAATSIKWGCNMSVVCVPE